MATTSVTQIVEQVIEVLSENISQIMMLVLVLQERNADPPPQFQGSVDVVTKTADTLKTVAESLAHTEYSEYPDIMQDILEAAASVGQSTDVMRQAINNLVSGGEKRAGWENLVTAIKNVSAKTIHLLQIVYGAERERIFRAAQRALDALNNLNPDMAAHDPKNFAQQVSDAATKAAQLAEYVRGKAEETQSPEQKAALQQMARELQECSRTLIEDANQLLRNPHDPNLKRQVAGDLQHLKDTIDKTTNLLNDIDHEFDDAHNNFLDRSADITDSLRELEAGGLASYDEDILLTAKRERQEMENLFDDLDRDDPDAARQALQGAKLQNDKLAKLAGMEANIVNDDPIKRQALLECQDELNRIFPQYEAAAKKAIANPDDDRAQDGLDAAHARLNDAIQRLCDLVSNPNAEIGAAARKECEDLGKMREAAISGDANGVSRNAKAVVKENKNLCDLCTAQAEKCEDPERQQMILDNVDELQRLLPHQILAAKRALEDPNPETINNLNKTTDTMVEQVKATAEMSKNYPELDLLAAAAKEKRLLDEMSGHANRGNQGGVSQVSPEMIDNTMLIGQLAREIARKKDKVRQAQIMDSVNKLEKLAQPTAADARALASRPNDPQLRQKVDREVQQMKDLVDKIIQDTDADLFAAVMKEKGDLHNMRNALDVEDPAGLAESTKQVVQDQSRLVPLARQAAKNTEDPLRRKQMMEDIDELERLLPRTVAQTNQVLSNPRDEEAGKKLRNNIQTMNALLSGLIDPNEYDPTIQRGGGTGDGSELARLMPELLALAELASRNPHDAMAQKRLQDFLEGLPLDALDSDQEKLARLLREADDALTRMTDAAERGDRQGVENAIKDVQNITNQLKFQARKVAENMVDPDKRQKILKATVELDRLLPVAYNSARQVAQNPNDPVKKKHMYDAVEDVRDQMRILAQLGLGSNESRLAEAAQREKDALARLRAAVQRGDVQGAREAMDEVKMYNNILCDEGRLAAKGVRDPNLNQRILNTVTELEKLMPLMDNDCQNGAANPRDQVAQRRAMADITKCENLINQLLNDTRSDPIAVAQLEDSLLTQLEAHVKSRDPASADDVKRLIDTQKCLKEVCNKEMQKMTNPAAKNSIQNALSELDTLLPPHVNSAKAVLQRPDDQAAKDGLGDSTNMMRAPIAQIIATIKPSPSNIARADAAREAALLAKLRQACGKGDRQECEQLLPQIKNMNDRLVNLAQKESQNPNRPPEAKQVLVEASRELDRLHNELPAIARAAAANPGDAQAQARLAVHTKKMENAMDRIVNALDYTESKSDKARRLASAMMRQSKSGRIDSMKFMNAAKTLADYIQGLCDEEGVDMDEQLRQLDAHSRSSAPIGRKQAPQDVDSLLQFLKDLSGKSEPKTFDELIQAVANDINRHMISGDEGDPCIFLTKKIALELSKMAQAARSGKKQEMVMASRNAAQIITELSNEHLKPIGSRCKDPHTQDKLNRAVMALKNYSVQMKILAAVRAASGKDTDADTEEQLVSVCRSLGNCLNESVATVQTMRDAKLLRP